MFPLVKSFVERGLEGSTRDPKMIKIMKVISKSYLDFLCFTCVNLYNRISVLNIRENLV